MAEANLRTVEMSKEDRVGGVKSRLNAFLRKYYLFQEKVKTSPQSFQGHSLTHR